METVLVIDAKSQEGHAVYEAMERTVRKQNRKVNDSNNRVN